MAMTAKTALDVARKSPTAHRADTLHGSCFVRTNDGEHSIRWKAMAWHHGRISASLMRPARAQCPWQFKQMENKYVRRGPQSKSRT